LLWAIEELYTGIDLARQEHADTQQRMGHLKNELRRERDLKVAAKGMSTGFTMAVRQRKEEVWHLKVKVTWQRDEVRKLWADVNGKSLVSLVVFLLGICGKYFGTIDM